jgi:hypothetical protein
LRFDLRPAGIAGTLDTRIAVEPRGDAALLAISQTGFRDLETGDAAQRRIRARFADAWVAAAVRARELATAQISATG